MMSFCYFIFAAWLSRLCLAGYIDATTYLKPMEEFCMSEVVGKDMYTHITLNPVDLNENEFLSAYIKEEGTDRPLFNETRITKPVSVSFTTIRGVLIVFCVTGPLSGGFISFTIKHGTDARDYSIIAKSTHMDPVDAKIQNVLDEFSAFHKSQMIGSQSIDRISSRATDTYKLLSKFAIANSLFVIIATLCYVYYFRNFFRSKKLI